jgi:hypothetical protein
MKSISRPIVVWITVFLCLLALSVGAEKAASQSLLSPGQPRPPKPEEVAELEAAFQQAVSLRAPQAAAYLLYDTALDNMKIDDSGDWATAWIMPVQPETGQPAPTEPGLALMQRTETGWQATLPSDPEFSARLLEAPTSLFTGDELDMWLAQMTAPNQVAAAFTGYKLPWAAGETRYRPRVLATTSTTPTILLTMPSILLRRVIRAPCSRFTPPRVGWSNESFGAISMGILSTATTSFSKT